MSKQNRIPLGFSPCLVCGVDSGPALTFFLCVVGAGLLATVSFLIWAIATKKLLGDREGGELALRAEDKEGNIRG